MEQQRQTTQAPAIKFVLTKEGELKFAGQVTEENAHILSQAIDSSHTRAQMAQQIQSAHRRDWIIEVVMGCVLLCILTGGVSFTVVRGLQVILSQPTEVQQGS